MVLATYARGVDLLVEEVCRVEHLHAPESIVSGPKGTPRARIFYELINLFLGTRRTAGQMDRSGWVRVRRVRTVVHLKCVMGAAVCGSRQRRVVVCMF